ncbi:MAG TPA: phage holin family protein [Candidatus Dormibacteraeota bacterium]|nr:phage holin family protein [Candidatus Dormibacteraeota bacterium]
MDSAPRASATDSASKAATNANGRRGLIDLARVAMEDTIRLVQQEIQLAKIEIKEMLLSNLKAAAFLGIAAFCGLLFFIMLLVTIALVIPSHALVAGIETVLFLILAVILALAGKRMLKIGPPPKTMTTLKEDAEWARQVLKRNGK